ncbi:MAG: DeoR/GlpR family DNA-binding transcription regulator [Vagococcus sp.]
MKAKRNELVKDYILEKENVSLKELQETFDVSMNTIRRDVSTLLEDPRFKKVYGGVSVRKNQLISFENRSVENIDAKKRIAKQAANLIQPNDSIYIDSGTTTKYILDYLDKDISITVITNSLDVLISAEKFEHMSVFIIGTIFKKSTRSFVGGPLDQISTKYNITKAFMAATAVSMSNGCMNSDYMEYELKKSVVEKASCMYLLVDASKFEKSTLLTYASLSSVDKIITDYEFDETYTTYFEKYKVEFDTITD